MHVTLQSGRTDGDWNLLRHRRTVQEALRGCAQRNGVKVYDFANVGSHVHLLVRARRRDGFQAFLRSFAGIVARKVTGASRGRPLPGGRFWRGLAWSRIVNWGRDYWGIRNYIFRNLIEATAGAAVRHALEQGPSERERLTHGPAP
jgi:REP element-mobilizing transposase RayT